MSFGLSIIAGFIAGEVAGYIAEQSNASPKAVRLTKCITAASVGTVAATVTGDLVGVVGVIVLGAAYLGGYDPVYIVGEAIGSTPGSKSNSRDNAS